MVKNLNNLNFLSFYNLICFCFFFFSFFNPQFFCGFFFSFARFCEWITISQCPKNTVSARHRRPNCPHCKAWLPLLMHHLRWVVVLFKIIAIIAFFFFLLPFGCYFSPSVLIAPSVFLEKKKSVLSFLFFKWVESMEFFFSGFQCGVWLLFCYVLECFISFLSVIQWWESVRFGPTNWSV